MIEQQPPQPEEYYHAKRFAAFVLAPIYALLVLGLFLVPIIKILGLQDNWAEIILGYIPNSTKGAVLAMAIVGLFLSYPKAVRSLNREKNMPLPGMTWIRNPLHSEYYEAQVPTENVNELVLEGKKLKKEKQQLEEYIDVYKILGNTYLRTITNTDKIQRSLRNRLLQNPDTFNLEDFLDEVATEICCSMVDDASDKSCSIMIIEGGELRIWGQSRIEPDSRKTTSFQRGIGFAGSIWDKGHYEIVGNVNEDPRFHRRSGIHYYNSIIGVPIIIWGDITGVICVQSEKLNGFTPNDAGIIQSFAEIVIMGLTLNLLLRRWQETYLIQPNTYSDWGGEDNDNTYSGEEGS